MPNGKNFSIAQRRSVTAPIFDIKDSFAVRRPQPTHPDTDLVGIDLVPIGQCPLHEARDSRCLPDCLLGKMGEMSETSPVTYLTPARTKFLILERVRLTVRSFFSSGPHLINQDRSPS